MKERITQIHENGLSIVEFVQDEKQEQVNDGEVSVGTFSYRGGSLMLPDDRRSIDIGEKVRVASGKIGVVTSCVEGCYTFSYEVTFDDKTVEQLKTNEVVPINNPNGVK